MLAWWSPSEIRSLRDAPPWRREPFDPWAVLVSEVMLAQTQVGRAAERFEPFLAQFPTPAAMAAATLGDVLRAWSGLGYPRRAAGLHRTARLLVADHRSRVPDDLATLLALPGIGAYTARAVMAFAFDQPVMPVDTNIGRVLARALAGQPLPAAAAQRWADLVAAASPGGGRRSAQAFMDLGAAICTARRPLCGECPLGALEGGSGRSDCVWFARRAVASGAGEAVPADPALRSASASRAQAAYEGSDRQGRGRMLAAAARGLLSSGELADAAGWPGDVLRAEAVVSSLLGDGLLERGEDGDYRLP